MKILYFSPHPNLNLASPSGPGTHMREMIAAFRDQGHEVNVCIMGGEHLYGSTRVVYSSSSGWRRILRKLLPAILWQTIKDLLLLLKDRKAAVALMQQVELHQPDLIYERGFYLMTSGVRVSRKTGIPLILEMNAPFPEEKIELEGRSFLLPVARRREKRQIDAARLVVVVSSGLKEYYSGRIPGSTSKILVTPNAIDPGDFREDDSRRADLKKLLDLDSRDVVIGFVGSIFPYHGVDRLLDSFAELCACRRDISLKLLMVGDGEILPELKQKAGELGISSRVIFTGNVPYSEVHAYISCMDICVLANSKWYCSPIKIFEYGALGKAVVSINTVAVRDVMSDGETGLLIDTAQDLTSTLRRLVDNPELRKKLALNWKVRVVKNHTWNAMAAEILGHPALKP